MGRIRIIDLLIVVVVGLIVFVIGAPRSDAEQSEFTLKQCIDLALGKNVGVIAAQNQLKSSQNALLDSWGSALPKVSTSADYGWGGRLGKQTDNIYDTGRVSDSLRIYDTGRDTSYVHPFGSSYSTGLNFSLTLFDGGATWLSVKKSALAKKTAENAVHQTINATAYAVKLRYFDLVRAVMLRKVRADALQSSKKQLEITTSRFELGSASLSEKLKSQVLVAQDSLNLLDGYNNIRKAELELDKVMNRDVTLPLIPLDTLERVEINTTLDQCVASAMEGNPGLRNSKIGVDIAKVGIWLARSSWYPSVSASMGWSWRTDVAGDWLKYRHDNGSYTVGIGISYNIFDGFRKKTVYSDARLSTNTSLEQYRSDQNNLVSNVKQFYLDFEKARLQYEVAKMGETSAQEDLKLQQERYRLGASSILELLNAQLSVTSAKSSSIQALYDLNVAVAGLANAMGQM